jgi:hypothetical protein
MDIAAMRAAYARGLRRREAAVAVRRPGRYGFQPDERHAREVDGYSAVAEALVAHTLGRDWISGDTVPDHPDAGDVAGGVAVRWTPRVNGSLILHPSDRDHLDAVLVVGLAPGMHIVGWINVAAGKQVGTWRTDVRHPAWFVSQASLHPIGDLL